MNVMNMGKPDDATGNDGEPDGYNGADGFVYGHRSGRIPDAGCYPAGYGDV